MRPNTVKKHYIKKEKQTKTKAEIIRNIFILVVILFIICVICLPAIVNFFDSSFSEEAGYSFKDLIEKTIENINISNDPRN